MGYREVATLSCRVALHHLDQPRLLKNLPNQPAVNRRVWKWVQVLQGYDCDIVHIAGKANPADFLSRRSIQDLRSMVDVRATEESMVQRLRLGEGQSTDEAIQNKLNEIFEQKGHPDSSDGQDKQNSQVNSFNSLISFSRAVLSSTRSTVMLESEVKREIRSAYQTDTRWSDLVQQLQADPSQKRHQGTKQYRLKHQLLEVRESAGTDRKWRIVIPDVPSIKKQILQEIHAVPYAGHLGYRRTLQKLQENFYWPDHTIEVRDFVLGCEVCQQEKSVHRLPAGLLEPLTLPEQKWADVSMGFILGLPKIDSGFDGILTVVDRATKMVHLVPVQQTITASEIALIYWQQVGKLHGIPRSIVSDRDPQFVSKFWQEIWRLLGTKLRMSSAHHPQTDGQTEAANRVVEMALWCTLHSSGDSTQWARDLPMIEFVINNSPSQSMGSEMLHPPKSPNGNGTAMERVFNGYPLKTR